MKRLSIKGRVTIFYTLLVAAIAVFALLTLVMSSRRMLKDYYRQSLESAAHLAENEILYIDGRYEVDRDLNDLPNVKVALYALDGELIYGKVYFEQAFEDGAFREAFGRTNERWYVYDTCIKLSDEASAWLRVFMSAESTRSLNAYSLELLMFIVPMLILLAGVGGYGITRNAFRPVTRITNTAAGIADGKDLKKRIALTGTKDEIDRLAWVFDQMLERLDDSFERERRFTADASHELRTPVAAIRAQSDFALSEAATDADRMEALMDIGRRAEEMSNLIGRLLMLARMDAGQMKLLPEAIDLTMLEEIIAQELAEEARSRDMVIEVGNQTPIMLVCDQTMMLQALKNLVHNAIRYGREGGHVRICACQDANETRISVADDGAGIRTEDMPHLFERFYQADASRHQNGAGLGLSLVQRIARLHGGRVDVQSVQGAGATFTLCIPRTGDDE